MAEQSMHDSRLDEAAQNFLWVLQQIPTGRQHVIPLPVFGEWSVTRIAFHVAWYWDEIITPIAQSWGREVADVPDASQEEVDWYKTAHTLPACVERFNTAHQHLLDCISQQDRNALQVEHETPWGTVTWEWVLLHAYQVLLEYTNTLMSMVLYWDHYLAAQNQARLEAREKNDIGWKPPKVSSDESNI